MAAYQLNVFQENSDSAGRFFDGVSNIGTKQTIGFISVKDGEKGVYRITAEAIDSDGNGVIGLKLIDYSRTRPSSTGAWTTAVAINTVMPTKRGAGFVTGIEFSAELSGTSIALTVTSMAAKDIYWIVRVAPEIKAIHPALL